MPAAMVRAGVLRGLLGLVLAPARLLERAKGRRRAALAGLYGLIVVGKGLLAWREARLALRTGFVALRWIAESVGIPVDPDPDPDGQLQLTYEEFLQGIERIAVLRLRGWDKAPIVGIGEARHQRLGQREHLELGIEVQLAGAAARCLDNNDDVSVFIKAAEFRQRLQTTVHSAVLLSLWRR